MSSRRRIRTGEGTHTAAGERDEVSEGEERQRKTAYQGGKLCIFALTALFQPPAETPLVSGLAPRVGRFRKSSKMIGKRFNKAMKIRADV
jgi:hypothetical protein